MTTRLSTLLLEHRISVGLSQAEMAALVGVSQAGYGKLESGISLPRPGTMKRIADATKLELSLLSAAKMAQYEWNNRTQTPVDAPSIQPTKQLVDSACNTSLELLAKLSKALASGRLQNHQVTALAAVVDSYLAEQGC